VLAISTGLGFVGVLLTIGLVLFSLYLIVKGERRKFKITGVLLLTGVGLFWLTWFQGDTETTTFGTEIVEPRQ
jgi:ABC-type transport system involved in cytochrome c biogenesis permease subunit